jgi:hypothetical protein
MRAKQVCDMPVNDTQQSPFPLFTSSVPEHYRFINTHPLREISCEIRDAPLQTLTPILHAIGSHVVSGTFTRTRLLIPAELILVVPIAKVYDLQFLFSANYPCNPLSSRNNHCAHLLLEVISEKYKKITARDRTVTRGIAARLFVRFRF